MAHLASFVKHSQRGFTLAEVLVALVVISVSFIALMKVSTDVTRNHAYLQDKVIAHWVAKYHITNLTVKEIWPDVGKDKGKMEMANRDWYWHQEVSRTTEPNFRRVEVAVSSDRQGKNRLTTLIGFVKQPQAAS